MKPPSSSRVLPIPVSYSDAFTVFTIIMIIKIILIVIININTGESKAASLQARLAARQAQAVLDPQASNFKHTLSSPPNHSLCHSSRQDLALARPPDLGPYSISLQFTQNLIFNPCLLWVAASGSPGGWLFSFLPSFLACHSPCCKKLTDQCSWELSSALQACDAQVVDLAPQTSSFFSYASSSTLHPFQ